MCATQKSPKGGKPFSRGGKCPPPPPLKETLPRHLILLENPPIDQLTLTLFDVSLVLHPAFSSFIPSADMAKVRELHAPETAAAFDLLDVLQLPSSVLNCLLPCPSLRYTSIFSNLFSELMCLLSICSTFFSILISNSYTL